MNSVFCPYCGSEMRLVELCGGFRYIYYCDICEATTPIETSPERAYAAAVHRPLQNPLTKAEALRRTGTFVNEYLRRNEPPRMEVVTLTENRFYEHDGTGGQTKESLNWDNYGRIWRLWEQIPNISERKAAKWEE